MSKGLEKYLYKSDIEKLMEIDLYTRCRFLINILFLDKVDKNGKPYIGHLLRVSSRMSSPDGRIAALLHDVVEDIKGITFEDLKEFGVPDNIIDALKLVTNEKLDKAYTKEEKLEIYNQKIDNIIESKNKLALELKLNDMIDNYDKYRISKLPKEKQEWFNVKYGQNIKKLKKARIEEN